MPRNRGCVPLPRAYVERIHDRLVATFWAFDEPVQPGEYRNVGLIESAVNRPFQSAFERAAYPTTVEKAAALFHSLVTNHPFENGNKRTAEIAADMFLAANGYFLYLGQDAIYRLATKTAQHNAMGISARQMFSEIRDKFRHNSLRIEDIRGNRETDQFRQRLHAERRNLRRGILKAIRAETIR